MSKDIKSFVDHNIKEIQTRIDELRKQINSIDTRLLTFEEIFDKLILKKEELKKQKKYVEVNRLDGIFVNNMKVYSELQNIRAKHEELIMKYMDQMVSNKFKLEQLDLQKAKLDKSVQDASTLLAELQNNISKIDVQLPQIEDPDYSL